MKQSLSILPWKESKGVGTGLGNKSWPMCLLALEWFFILGIRETFRKLKSIKEELADMYNKKNNLENKALSCRSVKDPQIPHFWLYREDIRHEYNSTNKLIVQ